MNDYSIEFIYIYFYYKEYRTIKNHIQKTDSSRLSHSRNSSMDSSSISTSEYFHFTSDKSPFDNDLNTTYCEDILDTEVITNIYFNIFYAFLVMYEWLLYFFLDGWK